MTQKLVVKEPVFIEASGKPIAVLMPIDLFHEWQAKIEEYPEIKNPTQNPGTSSSEKANEQLAGFEREQAAFIRLMTSLLQKYQDKYVAIVEEQVVEVGDNKIQVAERVYARLGNVPMYVQCVTETPPIYHIASPKVIRK